jgi:hypothetical protein
LTIRTLCLALTNARLFILDSPTRFHYVPIAAGSVTPRRRARVKENGPARWGPHRAGGVYQFGG